MLEFLGLKDDYSESQLEEALLGKLQIFLLELEPIFAVCRAASTLDGACREPEWYRVDLLFFHPKT